MQSGHARLAGISRAAPVAATESSLQYDPLQDKANALSGELSAKVIKGHELGEPRRSSNRIVGE